jgi:TolB protein
VQDLFPYATTNPVWIEIAGKPQTSPEDAAYFVRWIDRVIGSAGARDDYNTEAEKKAVLEDLRRARAVYAGGAPLPGERGAASSSSAQ